MQSAGPWTGRLLARIKGKAVPVLEYVPNIPLYYLVMLRERGAIYYVSTWPDTFQHHGYPVMMPLGIDREEKHSPLYGGFFQSILGEIGFRVDSRVYGVKVGKVAMGEAWYGMAQVADALTGQGALSQQPCHRGGTWKVEMGTFERTSRGTQAIDFPALASIEADRKVGLIGVELIPQNRRLNIGIAFLYQDADHHWRVYIKNNQAFLQRVWKKKIEHIATTQVKKRLGRKGEVLQILLQDMQVRVLLGHQVLFVASLASSDKLLAQAARIALYSAGQGYFKNLEVHAADVPIPEQMRIAWPWRIPQTEVVMADSLQGEPALLEGRVVSPNVIWERRAGKGIIEI